MQIDLKESYKLKANLYQIIAYIWIKDIQNYTKQTFAVVKVIVGNLLLTPS